MKIRKRLSPLLIVLREGELVKKLTFQLKTKRELSGGGIIEHKYLLAFAHICHKLPRMTTISNEPINKTYVISVSLLIFVLPILSYGVEQAFHHTPISYTGWAKWFLFYASGCRLLLAGIRQVSKPAFTAKVIFHMKGTESYPVIRELGFSNICTGLVAIAAFFIPAWRIVSAFSSGLYYGLAGVMHLVKTPASVNEKFALYTDLLVFG